MVENDLTVEMTEEQKSCVNMNIIKKLLDKIPTSIKKLTLLFLTIAISLGLFWYSYRVLGLPAMDSGIVPSTIFVFVLGLRYVPLEENEEK